MFIFFETFYKFIFLNVHLNYHDCTKSLYNVFIFDRMGYNSLVGLVFFSVISLYNLSADFEDFVKVDIYLLYRNIHECQDDFISVYLVLKRSRYHYVTSLVEVVRYFINPYLG